MRPLKVGGWKCQRTGYCTDPRSMVPTGPLQVHSYMDLLATNGNFDEPAVDGLKTPAALIEPPPHGDQVVAVSTGAQAIKGQPVTLVGLHGPGCDSKESGEIMLGQKPCLSVQPRRWRPICQIHASLLLRV